MAITKFSNSGMNIGTSPTKYDDMLAGNSPFIPNSYESISTVTVGAGGSSTVTFSSIPSTYKHLQIRGWLITNTDGGSPIMRFNSDSGSNYAAHWLTGNGSSASASSSTSTSSMYFCGTAAGTSATYPMPFVVDILDYANTNKNKVIRSLSGRDSNGSGEVGLYSGVWLNTSAVTTIEMQSAGRTISQYSSFALYGIKG